METPSNSSKAFLLPNTIKNDVCSDKMLKYNHIHQFYCIYSYMFASFAAANSCYGSQRCFGLQPKHTFSYQFLIGLWWMCCLPFASPVKIPLKRLGSRSFRNILEQRKASISVLFPDIYAKRPGFRSNWLLGIQWNYATDVPPSH